MKARIEVLINSEWYTLHADSSKEFLAWIDIGIQMARLGAEGSRFDWELPDEVLQA
jgi:hypothetical protein